MQGKQKYLISLSIKQEELLSLISKSRQFSSGHKDRARMILGLNAGKSRPQVASEVGVTVPTVRLWKKRWFDNQDKIVAYDKNLSGSEYQSAILAVLSDLYRSGTPGKFTSEQICSIINVACESPSDSDLPLSHWSLESLAQELKRRGIVESISTSQLCVF